MEITREVTVLAVEESDQCTVTVRLGVAEVDITPQEAVRAGFELIRLGQDAEEHEREQLQAVVDRVAAQPVHPFLDVDTTWWCRIDGCNLVFASKQLSEEHKTREHA
jgi:hypothetical protein